jgi:hypothetical protein
VVDVVVHEMFVPSLVRVTLAAGTTAPDESFTNPVTREVTCENVKTLSKQRNAQHRANALTERCLIASPINFQCGNGESGPYLRTTKVGAFYT